MVIAWHDAAFTLADPVLTPELMQRVLDKFHLQHKLKENWTDSTVDVNMIDKMIFMEDEVKASEEQQAAKKKRTEEILSKIDDERLAVKDFRIEKDA
jgi:hypothetical protein